MERRASNPGPLGWESHPLQCPPVQSPRSEVAWAFVCVQDDFPLASLPLLGYTVSTPEEVDGIHKEYVFKLQFKSHVYFFRAESEYTFER